MAVYVWCVSQGALGSCAWAPYGTHQSGHLPEFMILAKPDKNVNACVTQKGERSKGAVRHLPPAAVLKLLPPPPPHLLPFTDAPLCVCNEVFVDMSLLCMLGVVQRLNPGHCRCSSMCECVYV